jgi:hypothetical protein
LWRHLVPAQELKVLVYDPSYEPPPKRVPRVYAPSVAELEAAAAASVNPATGQPKFTKKQVAGRLRQIKLLYEEGLLTDEFNHQKVLECEATK